MGTIYYKLTASEKEGIITMDKRGDRKYFAATQQRFKLAFDAVIGNMSLTAYSIFSFPIDTENVMLKNIDVQREVKITSTDPLALLNIELLAAPLPHFQNHVFVGFSDQEPPAGTIYDLTSYLEKSSIGIPCMFSSNFKKFHLDNLNEQFHLGKNKGFLNVFVFMTLTDGIDITLYYAWLNTLLVAKGLTALDALFFEYSVNIAGRLI